MTICFSLGRWRGLAYQHRYTNRLYIGWLVVTWLPFDIESYFAASRRTLADLHECTLQQHREIERLQKGGNS